ncbi:MAG: right-handed parallel beta-helix repeat-containing protein [Clostridiales bacterium]|jgi:hypothetical protein|nr:right-handed parallel beta-helix repeat-containing protein [Clostridiales bacterium]
MVKNVKTRQKKPSLKRIVCLLAALLLALQAAACAKTADPVLTVTSAAEATIKVGQTYKLEYTAQNAPDGVTVDVARGDGGTGGGAYDGESRLFSAESPGAYVLTVTAKNGAKTAVATVKITVEAALPDIAEYVGTLGADEYAVPDLVGAYGLSDAGNVGVRASEAQKIKYPVKDDSEFLPANIIDFEGFAGTYADDSARLDAVIAEAKSRNGQGQGAVKIKLPNRSVLINADYAGTHIGGESAVRLTDFNGLEIVGAGDATELLIYTPTSWKKGIVVTNCQNLRLQNIRLDYKISPTLRGEVIDVDESLLRVTYKIPASFNETVQKLRSVPALGGTLDSVVEYDKNTSAPRERGNTLIREEDYFDSLVLSGEGENITAVLTFKEGYRARFLKPRPGELAAFAFTMYDAHGINVSGGKNLYLEGCGLNSAPGMAFFANQVENFYVNRFNMTLSRDRLMTATADGFHLLAMTGGVSITGSVLENSHDDAVNIKAGYYYGVDGADAVNKVLRLTRSTESNPLPRPGDVLGVYDKVTFDLIGRLTVVSATGGELIQNVTVAERLSGKDWIGKVVTNTTYAPAFAFADNIVRDKRNRGVLAQVPDAVIENNTFKNVMHGAVSLHTSLDNFNEGTLPQKPTVRNNKFINNGYASINAISADVSVFAFAESSVVAPSATLKEADVRNNYFESSGRAGVAFLGVSDSVIDGNLFYNTGRTSAETDFECAILLQNADSVTVSRNYNYYTMESETWAGIITKGLTKPDRITLTDNSNLYFQELDGAAPEYSVPKAASAIAVDGDLSDWNGAGYSVGMVGSSLATGDAVDASAYADVFGVEVCKLTWNDSGLYFAFRVRDDNPDYASAVDFWHGDCVELFLTDMLTLPNADFQLLRGEEQYDTLHLAVSPSWTVFASSRTKDAITANKATAQIVCVPVAGGYTVEAFLPFALLPRVKDAVDGGRGVAIAFVFADGDRDNIGRKRLQVSNVPHFVENYKTKTAKMPRYIFV